MLFILIVVLYPILNIIATSLSRTGYISSGSVTIWPKGFNLEAYTTVFNDPYIFKGYLNSIIYAAGSTGIMLLFTALMAYPLTIPEFAGKKFLTIFLMITMFFGGGLIPDLSAYARIKPAGYGLGHDSSRSDQCLQRVCPESFF